MRPTDQGPRPAFPAVHNLHQGTPTYTYTCHTHRRHNHYSPSPSTNLNRHDSGGGALDLGRVLQVAVAGWLAPAAAATLALRCCDHRRLQGSGSASSARGSPRQCC